MYQHHHVTKEESNSMYWVKRQSHLGGKLWRLSKTGATQHSPDETKHAHSASRAIHNTDILSV
jgi:hypothetical protein